MSLLEIFVLAIGLAMDATAVAAARGIVARDVRARDAVKLAALFGGFQAGMPFLGFLLGAWLGSFVAAWSHWISFVVLAGIGAKMIHEALGKKHVDVAVDGGASPFRTRVVLVLAIATSIDAFAVGVTLSMLHAPLLLTLVVVGVTTAALTVVGLYAGRRFGAMLGPRLEVLGGVVLVGIGAKILFDHFRGT